MVASPPPAALRDAATVVLRRRPRRGGADEVLLLRRSSGAGFAASMWVFPGGVVDAADRRLDASHWRGIDLAMLGRCLGVEPSRALGLAVAAVRETFEEAGLLLAARAGDVHPAPAISPGLDFAGWLERARVTLDLGALTPLSRWRTPAGEPRRYDTVFFTALAPEDQTAAADLAEVTHAVWLIPAAALDLHDRGRLPMIFPTVRTLAALVAGELPGPNQPLRIIQPHRVLDTEGRLLALVHPDDPDYPWERYPELAAGR